MYFCTRLKKCYLLKQTSTLPQQKSKSPHNHHQERLLVVTYTSTTSATWHVLFCSHCTKVHLVTPRVTRSLSLYISINFTSWKQKAEINSNPNVICDSSREGSSKNITTCYHLQKFRIERRFRSLWTFKPLQLSACFQMHTPPAPPPAPKAGRASDR